MWLASRLIFTERKKDENKISKREREVARCISLENDFWRIVRLILILCWRFLGICRILSLRQRVFMEYHWSYSAVYYIYRDGDLPACGVGWLKEIFSDGNLSHHPLHLFILFYLPTILQKPSFFFSFFFKKKAILTGSCANSLRHVRFESFETKIYHRHSLHYGPPSLTLSHLCDSYYSTYCVFHALTVWPPTHRTLI